MQIVTCAVALAGEDGNVVVRGEDRPVSYPEALLLAHIHGKEAVRDIKLLRDEDRDPDTERERLNTTYGAALVAQLFGADFQPLPEGDPRLAKRAAKEAADRARAEKIAKAIEESEKVENPADTKQAEG